ncbi:hypothetical protein DICPUDRAFT_153252 [Dictyostelium purpureum]|uniref:Uncharacterized protein n=1 Tax=Dictyostelium purpureum TaxID=5786 RepID=F0ZNF1_DICPU|nr:uncharacterized protein DICPUDRAFT_153252 [Dictyostelium purpureum]EGC34519.1 hypothetical protein DICPUDRAFT_153252 [Dictyostelium purpureum]|eukprot:XP_003288955.1 hypothetical protein DICPUDRAFT_153252 [Dictyostelium purpureum]
MDINSLININNIVIEKSNINNYNNIFLFSEYNPPINQNNSNYISNFSLSPPDVFENKNQIQLEKEENINDENSSNNDDSDFQDCMDSADSLVDNEDSDIDVASPPLIKKQPMSYKFRDRSGQKYSTRVLFSLYEQKGERFYCLCYDDKTMKRCKKSLKNENKIREHIRNPKTCHIKNLEEAYKLNFELNNEDKENLLAQENKTALRGEKKCICEHLGCNRIESVKHSSRHYNNLSLHHVGRLQEQKNCKKCKQVLENQKVKEKK